MKFSLARMLASMLAAGAGLGAARYWSEGHAVLLAFTVACCSALVVLLIRAADLVRLTLLTVAMGGLSLASYRGNWFVLRGSRDGYPIDADWPNMIYGALLGFFAFQAASVLGPLLRNAMRRWDDPAW